jgi:hypothetical protein
MGASTKRCLKKLLIKNQILFLISLKTLNITPILFNDFGFVEFLLGNAQQLGH